MKYSIIKKHIDTLRSDWGKENDKRFSTFAIDFIDKIHGMGYLLHLQNSFFFPEDLDNEEKIIINYYNSIYTPKYCKHHQEKKHFNNEICFECVNSENIKTDVIFEKISNNANVKKINTAFNFVAFHNLVKVYDYEKHIAFEMVLSISKGQNKIEEMELNNYNFDKILEEIKVYLNDYDCNLMDYFFMKLRQTNLKKNFNYDLNDKLLKYDYNKSSENITILVNDDILIDTIYYEMDSLFNLEIICFNQNSIIVNLSTKGIKAKIMVEKYIEEINKDTFRCNVCKDFEWLNNKITCNICLIDFCSEHNGTCPNCYKDNDINNCIDDYGHPEIDAMNEDMADFYGGIDI